MVDSSKLITSARERRSNIPWVDLVPYDVAHKQQKWERSQTALAARRAGLSFSEVGALFGLSANSGRRLIMFANHPRVSPVERWLTGRHWPAGRGRVLFTRYTASALKGMADHAR